MKRALPSPRPSCDALHFVLANIGLAPAHAVRPRFSRALRDVAGLRVNDNPLFTLLEFLAPGRRVRLFIDTLSGYTRRRKLTHDLAAWTALRDTL
jgi:hypothetical protein